MGKLTSNGDLLMGKKINGYQFNHAIDLNNSIYILDETDKFINSPFESDWNHANLTKIDYNLNIAWSKVYYSENNSILSSSINKNR